MATTLRDNIASLTARARAEAEQAPFSHRVAERIARFTGSMTFVLLHVVLYGSWIAINIGWVPLVPKFDPGMIILAMEASVEAIFLSTFVLISQNRMAREAERRADLDLHISLLAEHELTRLAVLVEQIAEHVGAATGDSNFDEIKRDVAPTTVLDALDERKRAEGLDR